jgi:hypothetical protein
MKNYIEKNYKWLVRIFVVVWIFLILKLWYFWVYWICGWWGWYINLCIIPTYKYFWTNAWYISMAFLLLSILIIIWIYFIKNKILKVLLAFIILFLWIIGKPLFYYLSPDFKFYYTDEYLSYMDKEFHPKDVDLYLEYIWKYCNETIDDFNYKNLGRDSMCGWKYLYDFETVEDYKKVFDFANKNNMRELYRLTFIWAQDFWLEKIIKGYRDDTFYGYVDYHNSKVDIIELLAKNTNNELLKKYFNEEIKKINYFFVNSKEFTQDQWYKYWDNLSDEIYNKLKQIKTINTKVF